MANAKFNYGFEYLGVQDKLVQTPLTDRCYLCMTQALEARLGGSPFGMLCFRGAKSQCCICLKFEDVMWWQLSWMVLIFNLFSEGMGAVWFSCLCVVHVTTFLWPKKLHSSARDTDCCFNTVWVSKIQRYLTVFCSVLTPTSLWLIIFVSCASAKRHCLCLKCCLAVCSGKMRQYKVIHLDFFDAGEVGMFGKIQREKGETNVNIKLYQFIFMLLLLFCYIFFFFYSSFCGTARGSVGQLTVWFCASHLSLCTSCIGYEWYMYLISGPAGTGKTESVKALGNQLGRFVLVFNCDETFDFQVS